MLNFGIVLVLMAMVILGIAAVLIVVGVLILSLVENHRARSADAYYAHIVAKGAARARR